MSEQQKNYKDWVDYYYKKVKPFLPMLLKELRKQDLTIYQSVIVLEGVFRRVVIEVRRKTTKT